MGDQKVKQDESKKNAAVLVIDMISDFDFEDGDKLFANALRIAPQIFQIKQYAREHKIPFVFVNDSYGKWHRDLGSFIEAIRKSNKKAEHILDLVRPKADDLYILKPQRSGFYDTDLEHMLEGFNVNHVLITGLTTDICVLFTAHDAYMRALQVRVPADCTAAVEDEFHRQALDFLERIADVDTTTWKEKSEI